MNWKRLISNFVLDGGKDFYISFNPTASDLSNPEGGETALVRKSRGKSKFYILRGDYRKDYEDLVGEGYRACKKFFDAEARRVGRGFWSN